MKVTLEEDNKVLVYGRVNASDDKDAKIICEGMKLFSDVNNVVWLIFDTREEYSEAEAELMEMLEPMQGNDRVWIFIKKERLTKGLDAKYNVTADAGLINTLKNKYGENLVKVQKEKVKFERIKRYKK